MFPLEAHPDRLILGCGYLGTRVAARWLSQGRRVFAATRRPERAAELRRLGLEPVVCDVLDPASLRALPPVPAVLHAVGLDRSAGLPMRTVYVDGLANVLEALTAWPGLPRFVYVSSTGVYGSGEVDETAAPAPAEESGRVVLEAEELLRRRLPGAVVLRCAGLYGPGRLIGARALQAGTPIEADPDGWLNLIHVEDAAEACVLAEQRGGAGAIYNVSDGRPVRRRDFYGLLAEVLGTAAPRFAAAAGEGRRVVNRRLIEELGLVLKFKSYAAGLAAAV